MQFCNQRDCLVIYEGHACRLGLGIFAWKVNLCTARSHLQRPESLAAGACCIWLGNIWKKQYYALRTCLNCQFVLMHRCGVSGFISAVLCICIWGIHLPALEASGELRLWPINTTKTTRPLTFSNAALVYSMTTQFCFISNVLWNE